MPTTDPNQPGIDGGDSVPVPLLGPGTIRSATLVCDGAATAGTPFVNPSTLRIAIYSVKSTTRVLLANLDFQKSTGGVFNTLGANNFERMTLTGLAIGTDVDPLGAQFTNLNGAAQVDALRAAYLAIEIEPS